MTTFLYITVAVFHWKLVKSEVAKTGRLLTFIRVTVFSTFDMPILTF